MGQFLKIFCLYGNICSRNGKKKLFYVINVLNVDFHIGVVYSIDLVDSGPSIYLCNLRYFGTEKTHTKAFLTFCWVMTDIYKIFGVKSIPKM